MIRFGVTAIRSPLRSSGGTRLHVHGNSQPALCGRNNYETVAPSTQRSATCTSATSRSVIATLARPASEPLAEPAAPWLIVSPTYHWVDRDGLCAPTRASLSLLEAEFDTRTVQELLGHRCVRTKLIYRHLQAEGRLGVRSLLQLPSPVGDPRLRSEVRHGASGFERELCELARSAYGARDREGWHPCRPRTRCGSGGCGAGMRGAGLRG